MGRKRDKIVFDEWEVYATEAEGAPLFVSFDVEAAREDLSDSLTHCARVLIPIHEPNENGGPTSPESEYLYEMEDALCAALTKRKVKCRLVGRLTHQGMRELVFQLDDWDSFRPPVGLWMTEHPDYEIDVSEHEGWDFFNEFIRPTDELWLFIADRNVIETLLESGSNPRKKHSLEFAFYGEADSLQELHQRLSERGYQPLGEPDFSSGSLTMIKKMKLDVNEIFAETLSHSQLAEELGIEYDGWGCEVVK